MHHFANLCWHVIDPCKSLSRERLKSLQLKFSFIFDAQDLAQTWIFVLHVLGNEILHLLYFPLLFRSSVCLHFPSSVCISSFSHVNLKYECQRIFFSYLTYLQIFLFFQHLALSTSVLMLVPVFRFSLVHSLFMSLSSLLFTSEFL